MTSPDHMLQHICSCFTLLLTQSLTHPQEKESYKASFDQLRNAKREIEHLHMLLEQSRVRLARDFEQWMGFMGRQAAASGAAPGAGSVSPAGTVPYTPGFPGSTGGAATPTRTVGPSSPYPPSPVGRGSAAPSPAASIALSSPQQPPGVPRQAWGDAAPASSGSTGLLRASSGPGATAVIHAPAGAQGSGAARSPEELVPGLDPKVGFVLLLGAADCARRVTQEGITHACMVSKHSTHFSLGCFLGRMCTLCQ